MRVARLARATDRRQVDVARPAGISISYLSMIENGLVPPLRVRERLATVLGVAVEELWTA